MCTFHLTASPRWSKCEDWNKYPQAYVGLFECFSVQLFFHVFCNSTKSITIQHCGGKIHIIWHGTCPSHIVKLWTCQVYLFEAGSEAAIINRCDIQWILSTPIPCDAAVIKEQLEMFHLLLGILSLTISSSQGNCVKMFIPECFLFLPMITIADHRYSSFISFLPLRPVLYLMADSYF